MSRFIYVALLLPLLAIPSSSQDKKKRESDPLMVAKLKEAQTLLEGLALTIRPKFRRAPKNCSGSARRPSSARPLRLPSMSCTPTASSGPRKP